MAESSNSHVGDLLHRLWVHVGANPLEIVWAAFFGLIFALIFDLLSPEGRVRTGMRHIKNKWSERSARGLRKRIEQLKINRDRVAAYLSSDKALYLATFQLVIGMLFAMSIGAAATVLDTLLGPSPLLLLSVLFYVLAIVVGIQGLKISSLDTRAKITAMLGQLESEIADLSRKLEAIAK